MEKKPSFPFLRNVSDILKYQTKIRNACLQSYGKRFKFPENKLRNSYSKWRESAAELLRFPEWLRLTKVNACFFLPGLVLCSWGSLVLYALSPGMLQDLTACVDWSSGQSGIPSSFGQTSPFHLHFLFSRPRHHAESPSSFTISGKPSEQ